MLRFHGEKLLIVEAEDDIRHMLRLYFGEAGCQARAVETPEEGLRLLADFEPDAVILYNEGAGFTGDAKNSVLFERCMTQKLALMLLNTGSERYIDEAFFDMTP